MKHKQKQKVVATIFNKQGRKISSAVNSYTKTHPMQARLAAEIGKPESIFLHAEIAALVRCREKPYKIRVERHMRNGELGNAKPCPICELAIKRAGIKFVEYSI